MNRVKSRKIKKGAEQNIAPAKQGDEKQGDEKKAYEQKERRGRLSVHIS